MPSAISAPLFKDFNKSVKDFLLDLVTTFPEIDMFKVLQTSFVVTKNIHRKLPYKLANEHMFQHYGEQLSKKDEEYFLSDKFTCDFWPALIDVIKKTYVTIDDVNKKAIWDHLLNMYTKHKCIENYYKNKPNKK